jgi:hypothetical protein
VSLMEITMKNLQASGQIDYSDFLARADALAACGQTVLISNYFEYYRLAAYLTRYTQKRIGIVMGIPSLREVFNEKYYSDLEGGILESFGRLFKNDLKIYAYPFKDKDTGELTKVDTLKISDELSKLYGYLVENGFIVQLENYNEDILHIFSRDILRRIKEGDATWETMLPDQVAHLIKERRFFGYRE